MSAPWSPEELAAQDQIEATFRAIESLGSPSLHGNPRAKAKTDRVLDQNRRYLASRPDGLYLDGRTVDRAPEAMRVLRMLSGGLELPGATIYEVTTHDTPPIEPYDPDNPEHQRAPFIVFANEPEFRYVVRLPLTVPHLVVGISTQAVGECDWHNGPPRRSSTGVQQLSLLSIARGQYLVVFAVCGKCRERLQRAAEFYGHSRDVTLHDAEGVDGFPVGEWEPYHPDEEGRAFPVCVLWTGLRWTMPMDVTLGGDRVTDPRAWVSRL